MFEHPHRSICVSTTDKFNQTHSTFAPSRSMLCFQIGLVKTNTNNRTKEKHQKKPFLLRPDAFPFCCTFKEKVAVNLHITPLSLSLSLSVCLSVCLCLSVSLSLSGLHSQYPSFLQPRKPVQGKSLLPFMQPRKPGCAPRTLKFARVTSLIDVICP